MTAIDVVVFAYETVYATVCCSVSVHRSYCHKTNNMEEDYIMFQKGKECQNQKGKQMLNARDSHFSHLISHFSEGISLIALIITIIVIIILAAIVIFSGLNTPDRANLAKFVQEISDFRLAVQQDFMNKKAEYAISGKSRSDAQIYYIIANGGNPDIITDIMEM